jgi:pimeloyl-ACP methyl ester carboxylesterase
MLRALGIARLARLFGRALRYLTWWSWRAPSEQRTTARFSIMGVLQEGQAAFRDEVAAREILADNDNAAALEHLGFRTDLTDQLARISCPVLVIFGDHDAPFAAGAQLLAAGLPNVRTIRFENVGHHPLVEERDRTLTAIADALERA